MSHGATVRATRTGHVRSTRAPRPSRPARRSSGLAGCASSSPRWTAASSPASALRSAGEDTARLGRARGLDDAGGIGHGGALPCRLPHTHPRCARHVPGGRSAGRAGHLALRPSGQRSPLCASFCSWLRPSARPRTRPASRPSACTSSRELVMSCAIRPRAGAGRCCSWEAGGHARGWPCGFPRDWACGCAAFAARVHRGSGCGWTAGAGQPGAWRVVAGRPGLWLDPSRRADARSS